MIDLFDNDNEENAKKVENNENTQELESAESITEIEETEVEVSLNNDVVISVKSSETNETAHENTIEQSEVVAEVIGLEDEANLLRRAEEIEEEEKQFPFEKKSFQESNTKTEQKDYFADQVRIDDYRKREIDQVKRPSVQVDLENYGITFRKLRETTGLSLDVLSTETHISKSYLIALEEENYSELPAEVYIIAYIRRLGLIYHLTEDEIFGLSQKVRIRLNNKEFELPDDPEKVILDYESSSENAEKMRKIIWGIATILLLLVAAILLLLGVIKNNKKSNQTGEVRTTYSNKNQFRTEEILEIQDTPKLNYSALPMPKKNR